MLPFMLVMASNLMDLVISLRLRSSRILSTCAYTEYLTYILT